MTTALSRALLRVEALMDFYETANHSAVVPRRATAPVKGHCNREGVREETRLRRIVATRQQTSPPHWPLPEST